VRLTAANKYLRYRLGKKYLIMDEEEQPRKRSKKSALVHYGSQGMGVGPSQETESELMASSLDLVRKKNIFSPKFYLCLFFKK
jgi:hypothetical protein